VKKIQLIEIKSELGAGTRGASMAVDAVKIASLDFGSSYFKKYPSIEIQEQYQHLLEPVKNDYAKRIKHINELNQEICSKVKSTVVNDNAFPIIISGDHSSSIGTISGIKAAYPGKRIGVIWIDAHADMHSPYTTPSGNMHGMPLAALLGEDNKEKQINNPDEETVKYWNKLKNIGSPSPKIMYEDLVLVTLRDTEPQEDHLIKSKKVKVFTVSEMRKKGVERISIEALYALEQCDFIHVSFDVDSMDPSISKGTGTPTPNGITEKEAGNFIYYLLRNKKICCFEIVEINPTLDKENIMAENAFEVLLKATNRLTNDF